jgi:voltage-gated potassium channel
MNEELVSYASLRRRVYLAGLALFVVVFGSAGGFYVLGGGRWHVGDCLYMTITTLATVGFGELLPGMSQMPLARLWTVGVILSGSGIIVYWVSSFTALIVEGDLRGVLRRRRMDKLIAKMRNHVVVCGAGTTGVHAIRELIETRTPFVVIDHSHERLHGLSIEYSDRIVYIQGEATDDAVLEAAGVTRAAGVLVMLHEDRDNLFCTLSARALNAKVRIVSKAVEHSSQPKLLRAGADRVVSPNYIGGMRLASEMIRPTVVEFLDTMLRGDDQLRIEEVRVPGQSPIVGRSLREVDFRGTLGTLVLAVRDDTGGYHFNPGPESVIRAGDTLILMAHADEVMRIRSGIVGPSSEG